MPKKLIKITVLLLLPFFLLPVPVLFAEGEQLGYTTYYFSDSGGNSVVTTSFNLAKRILKKTVFLLDLEVDNVTVPAITAVTGATRPRRQSNKPFKKTRGQAIVGLEQGIDANTSLAVNAYRSQEVDYVSNSLIGSLTHDMFQQNTTLTLRGQFIADKVGKILDDGKLVNQDKTSYWGMASLRQLLSPTTVLNLSYDGIYLKGFLSDPYREVKVFDANNRFIMVEEHHPDNRLRQAVTAKLNQAIPAIKASITGNYRYYWDDWGVKSHTAEIQFNKYVLDDLITRFHYRYYFQDKADFYQDHYTTDYYPGKGFLTSDYKLQRFFSNNFGISLTLLFRKLAYSHPTWEFLKDSSVEIRYFRYFNTLDFSANIFQMNVNFGI